MILVVDHYDSFTYNLVQLLESLGTTTEVVKSDAETAEALVARRPGRRVLSPGPGRPEDAGCFTELLRILPADDAGARRVPGPPGARHRRRRARRTRDAGPRQGVARPPRRRRGSSRTSRTRSRPAGTTRSS